MLRWLAMLRWPVIYTRSKINLCNIDPINTMISTMDSLNNSNTSHNTHTMSFKQTLKLHYNDNVIKTFNHSSKLAFKLTKASCHISFLKSCRDFSITPKGLTLSDPLKSCRSNEILHKAQSLLVTSRLQQFKHGTHLNPDSHIHLSIPLASLVFLFYIIDFMYTYF